MGGDWTITFLQWWWLLALVPLAPLVLWLSAGSLSGLGRVRGTIAILLRLTLIALLLAVLAQVQLVRTEDRLCTLFVVDASQSMPEAAVDRSLAVLSEAIRSRERLDDHAGVVVVGKEPRIESPPARYPLNYDLRAIGSRIERQHTDLSAGIKLALGSFPPDLARRIVLISDGNQNRGDVLAQAVAARDAGVPIDVIPIEYRYEDEVLVDDLVLPPDLKRGDTANLKVVLRSGRPVEGTLRLQRVSEGRSEPLFEDRIALDAGLNVRVLKQTIDEPGLHRYEATFEPDPDAGDRRARNNEASAFTWIRGEGRVLLLEANGGAQEPLAEALRQDGLAVTSRLPDQVRQNIELLREYDCVILGNVPAEELGEEMEQALAANTQSLGAGLVMVGGPDSFGAGGYKGSEIEKALPVDMDVKSTKVRGKGALVLIMHACEIPEGNFWEKKVAQLAIDMLSDVDECGLLRWNGAASWLFPLAEIGPRRGVIGRRIDRMTPGDMPDFESAMRLGVDSLIASTAATKHMIIISDGDPSPPSAGLLQRYRDARITITTVAIAAHGSHERVVMRRIARETKGRYYEVRNSRALPQIYMKETRIVSRPLIYEQPMGWQPLMEYPTEPVAGLPQMLPEIKGFVLTTPKPLADVPVTSPIPAENDVNPIVAHWPYGLGRSIAVTTDSGDRWATAWRESEVYRKFWSQMIRWAMRPAESQQLSLSMQRKDGKVQVVVNALDEADRFLDFLPLEGRLLKPDSESQAIEFQQTAPGKYVAEFDAEESGGYFLNVGYGLPDGSSEMVRAGLNIPYPQEYRDTESNRDLMENVALVSDGRVIELDSTDGVDFFLRGTDPTDRLQDAWPLALLVAMLVFLVDIAVRRIAVDIPALFGRMRRAFVRFFLRKDVAEPQETMDRLRSKKASLEQEFSRQRFQLSPEEESGRRADAGPSVLEESAAGSAPSQPRPTPPKPAGPTITPTGETEAPESYTDRLKRAKRQVWRKEDEENPPAS